MESIGLLQARSLAITKLVNFGRFCAGEFANLSDLARRFGFARQFAYPTQSNKLFVINGL
jgi:hypothetical protein